MIICTHSHAFFVILHDNWMRKMTKLNEASLKTVQFFLSAGIGAAQMIENNSGNHYNANMWQSPNKEGVDFV